ncbi:MAG TPA: DUF4292 domain-containing protein [Mucilaginibacter sp.]|jgi:hypothetical protein
MKKNTSNSSPSNIKVFFCRYAKLLTICCLLALVSCKAKKQLLTTGAAGNTTKPADNKRSQLDAIRAGQTNFDTFSGKAHTKLNFSGSSNDVTLNIRIKKNQKIWVSVTAIAGIEVARALITPDSILTMNKLQSVYLKQPFSYLYKMAGKDFNYKTLESLLTGNAIPELINESAVLQTKGDTITLTGNLQDVMYKLILGPGMKVAQTNLDNKTDERSLQATNSNYIQTGNRSVASQIDIASASKDQKVQIGLHYVKVDLDQPLEFPFTIPTRYKEIN